MIANATADTLFAGAMVGFPEPSTRSLIVAAVVSLIFVTVFLRMKLG